MLFSTSAFAPGSVPSMSCPGFESEDAAYAGAAALALLGTGLVYLQDKCSRILVSTLDYPFFSAETAVALLEPEAPLLRPVCGGREGYPVRLLSSLMSV